MVEVRDTRGRVVREDSDGHGVHEEHDPLLCPGDGVSVEVCRGVEPQKYPLLPPANAIGEDIGL